MEIRELVDGTSFVAGTFFDIATVGYEIGEYAVSGEADAYAHDGAGLTVVERAPFTTRVIVHRPRDPAHFNGTVVVEWLNVSAGLDAAPVWLYVHRELVRQGAAWVGVSAQRVGVHGGQSLMAMPGMSLVEVSPERYGGLDHPGDRFSYDLYTQVGSWARTGQGTSLEDLPVARVLAVGESQSAYRLTTYLNEPDLGSAVYDGFLVHARGGSAAPLDDAGDVTRIIEGEPAPFGADLPGPVLCVEAETDLINLTYRDARQDDAERLVVWEIAGASHADVYTFSAGFADDGLQPIENLARAWRPSRDFFGQELDLAVNAGPQHYVMQAALRALDAWVADGTRPPASPRLELTGEGFATDEHGNALGGIRTPHVDVPVSTLSGLGNGGAPIAFLAGSTLPFDRDRLTTLYRSKETYVERCAASAAATADAGFFVPEDVDEVVAIAALNVDL